MLNEIITCIKLIKMYGWEKSFAKVVRGMSILSCSSQPVSEWLLLVQKTYRSRYIKSYINIH